MLEMPIGWPTHEPRPCRVALVGAGYTAREHARAFASLPGVTVAGIQSRTRARAEALAHDFGIANVCDTIVELFERTQAELAVVTVNELSMASVSQACFAYPWTVLLEKPPGHHLREAREIQAAAHARGRRVLVALNRRSMATTLTVARELEGLVGHRFIKVQDQQNQAAALELGHRREVVDHWMYANAIHMVDYLRAFGRGEIASVTRILPYEPASPGVVMAMVRFTSGDIGVYEGIWHGPGPWAVSVTADRRRWELRPLEQGVAQVLGQRPVPMPLDQVDSDFKPGFRRQAAGAVAFALGSDSGSVPTLDTALESMQLVHEIFRT